MKRFLSKILIAALVMLMLLGTAEWLARRCPNQYRYKVEWMEQHAAEVETLILGSSTSYYGIHADRLASRAFSLANQGQSPRYDWLLFAADTAHYSLLHNVILTTPSLLLNSPREVEETSWHYCIYYHLYCHCPDHGLLSRYAWELACYPEARKKILESLGGPLHKEACDSLGCGRRKLPSSPNPRLTPDAVEKSAQRDAKVRERIEHSELPDYPALLAQWCQRHQVRFLLLSPPVYPDYAQKLDSMVALSAFQDSLVGALLDRCPDVTYRDYSADPRFTADDFFDANHLNIYGAEKFTRIIRKDFSL